MKPGRVVILIKDYNEALEFYKEKLGFREIVDYTDGGRRYVHLHLQGQENTGIWLLKAESEAEEKFIGKQAAGQPFLVFYTDDFKSEYRKLASSGVKIVKEPVTAGSYTFARFTDLYGNEMILVELAVQK